MGVVKTKWKKILFLKAWMLKGASSKGQRVPNGCFSVYVGAERQRFVVKTEFVNHPLFKMLLDEAEVEYGFNSDGPIWLPCNVDLFYKVLAEILADEEYDKKVIIVAKAKGSSSLFFLLQSPARLLSYMSSRDHRASSVMDSEML
ncbi:auxin-responsive protein SAUR32-like [Lotus japonicus]|uniref:Uncharacterized protein n=1 Tax=Lotus japonicus TaxID=34305 RepID=I3SQ69_LOTJA|nr:auxin-responsive protein SAUR32-like [Lotus japonicus]AFK42411.1 unknown [Lotus japonicus]